VRGLIKVYHYHPNKGLLKLTKLEAYKVCLVSLGDHTTSHS